jgi:3-hydroxyacyl-CoA dehydrogenase
MIYRIQKAAVLGAGVMGGGIAALLASAGIRTLLLDIVPFDLTEEEKRNPSARNRIAQAGLKAVQGAMPALLMDPADADLIETGNFDDDFDKLASCDWIVEVVVENLKIKQTLLKKVDGIRSPNAIVSTNTSGIPLAKISEGLSEDFKKHFLGTHFFNPVRYMKLLELIPGKETLPEIFSFMAKFGERRLGKGIVRAKDTPNFVGNRIGIQGSMKTMHLMLEKGLSIVEVDALLGPVMGRPKTAAFKTGDLVGLDILGHVAQNTYEMIEGDEAREDFTVPNFIKNMIEKKLLGKKTGAGFYKTEFDKDFKKIRKVIDPETLEYVDVQKPQIPCLATAKKVPDLADRMKAVVYADDPGGKFTWEAMAHNLIYAANRIPEISDTIVEIDRAIRWGFNFEMGPFETWDAIGVAESIEKMEQEGFVVPEKVKEMISSGCRSFYKTEEGRQLYYDFNAKGYEPLDVAEGVISLAGRKAAGGTVKTCDSASLVDLGDGVFCCEFHTRMNALNGEISEFVSSSLDYVEENGVGMVIGNQAGGMPGAFSAGADIKFLKKHVDEKRFDVIDDFLSRGQQIGQKAKYAPFPVVAAPFGLTLGGGCEVCLGADRMVAHAELYMGLVEIGVGLLPAGGGCLNLWKKFINALPEAMGDTDRAKCFLPTFTNIAMAKVSTSAADARKNGYLGPKDRIVANRDHLIGEAKKEVLRMVEDGYAPPVKRPLKVFGEAAQGMVNGEMYNMGKAGYVTEHDAFLARRIAYVISGGTTRTNGMVDEDVILTLEREAFVDFLKEEKTVARIDHMIKTGRPLRN